MSMEVFNTIHINLNKFTKRLISKQRKSSLFLKLLFNHKIDYYFNSYRIGYAMDGYMIQDISLKHGHMIYKEIVCAVNIHRQAIKFVYSSEHFKSLCILHKHYSKHKIMYMQNKILII